MFGLGGASGTILQTKKLRHTEAKGFCQDNMVSSAQDWGPVSSLSKFGSPSTVANSFPEVWHHFVSVEVNCVPHNNLSTS